MTMGGRLGILAGGKDLPKEVINHCRETNRPYFVIAFEGQTDPEAVVDSDHAWVRLGAVGESIKHLKKAGVEDIVMVGPIRRPSWREIRPDTKGAFWLARLAKHAFGDDSLLRIIIDEIEKEGFRVIGAEDLIGSKILAPAGQMGKHKADAQAMKDISHGIKVAKILGQADVGQSVIVQDGLVLGVEAVEGTNDLIKRCEHLHKQGPGGVLVKMVKMGQDRRVDLPTIGSETVELAHRHGLRGIAVQAHSVQLLQREEAIAIADKKGLFLLGVVDD
jgi:UDP-2,3-diacylglucosamine hydrolase